MTLRANSKIAFIFMEKMDRILRSFNKIVHPIP